MPSFRKPSKITARAVWDRLEIMRILYEGVNGENGIMAKVKSNENIAQTKVKSLEKEILQLKEDDKRLAKSFRIKSGAQSTAIIVLLLKQLEVFDKLSNGDLLEALSLIFKVTKIMGF